MRVLCLHSGGINSTVMVANAVRKEGAENVGVCYVNYGQKSMVPDSEAFLATSRALNIEALHYHVLELKELFKSIRFQNTRMVGGPPVPVMSYTKDEEGQVPKVPLLNTILLTAAVSVAMGKLKYDVVQLALDADEVWEGAISEVINPIQVVADALHIASGRTVDIELPLRNYTKAEIVAMPSNYASGAPLDKTYSCLMGKKHHCGQCAGCLRRKKAFKDGAIKDPTHYQL